MTGGCVTLSGTPPLAVDLPNECDEIARPVPYPFVKGEDLGVRSARFAAALGEANTRLVKASECEQAVRQVFSERGLH